MGTIRNEPSTDRRVFHCLLVVALCHVQVPEVPCFIIDLELK